MSTAAETSANVAEDKKVLAGENLDPGALYLINNNIRRRGRELTRQH